MTERGRLIAFEGGDGAGKSTQSLRLASSRGAELTREPGGTYLGDRIREWLLHPEPPAGGDAVDPRAELMLMLAARAQHVAERIAPALASGRDVVVDRFSGSTLAYQGYGRGLPLPAVKAACDLAASGLWPDLTLLLDVPVAIGAARLAVTGVAPDRIEAARGGFHERVAKGFRSLAAADPDRWLVIDATRAVDTVTRLVLQGVEERLGPGRRR